MVGTPPIKILLSAPLKVNLDHTETVTTQFEVVGSDPGADVAKIEGRFAVVRRSRVGVWDKHVRYGQAIEDASAVIADIMQGQSLTVIETDAESPFLPFYDIPVDSVARALWLNDIVRLQSSAFAPAEFVVVFVTYWDLVVSLRRGVEGIEQRETDNLVDFLGCIVNARRKVKRDGVMVGFGVIMRRITKVHVALPFPRLVIIAVRAVCPGITGNNSVGREVESFKLFLDFGRG